MRRFSSRAFRSMKGGTCPRCDLPIRVWEHWVQYDKDHRIVHANCANPTNNQDGWHAEE